MIYPKRRFYGDKKPGGPFPKNDPLPSLDDFVRERAQKNMDVEYKGKPLPEEFDRPGVPKLYPFQKEAIHAVLSERVLFLDIFARGGKTRIILESLVRLKKRGEIRRALVVCYNVVSAYEWVKQSGLWAPELSVASLPAKTKQKVIEDALLFRGDVLFVTYGQLFTILTDLKAPQGGKGRKKFVLHDWERARAFSNLFDMVVFDESREMGSPGTITHLLCRFLGKNARRVVTMTATPFSHDPAPLWVQGHVLDGGATFGERFSLFRGLFYSQKKVPFGPGVIYTYRRSTSKALNKLFKNLALSYNTSEVGADFPEVSVQSLAVPMGHEQRQAYMKLMGQHVYEVAKANFQSKNGDRVSLQSSLMVFRQVASGFVYTSENAPALRFSPNPKLDETLNLIKEIEGRSKVVVFFWFKESGRMLAESLKSAKIAYSTMFGGEKEASQHYQEFQQSPHIRVLLANAEQGGVGLNLSVADYVIFYEPPASFYIYHQAVRRVLVPGKKTPVFVYHLYSDQSIEKSLYSHFVEGKELWKEILDKDVSIEDVILGAF